MTPLPALLGLCTGTEHARRLRTLAQKVSLCLAVGRLSADTVHAQIAPSMAEVCAEVVAKASRVERANALREQYRLFQAGSSKASSKGSRKISSREPDRGGGGGGGGGGAGDGDASGGTGGDGSSGGGGGSAPGAGLELGRCELNRQADPHDPSHATLSRALRQLGEALALLISPHLSGKSVAELDALVAFLADAATLEALFGEEPYQQLRQALVEHCQMSIDG